MGEPKAAALSRLQNLKAILQLVPLRNPKEPNLGLEHVQSNLMHSPLRNLTGAQGEFIHSPQMQKHWRHVRGTATWGPENWKKSWSMFLQVRTMRLLRQGCG